MSQIFVVYADTNDFGVRGTSALSGGTLTLQSDTDTTHTVAGLATTTGTHEYFCAFDLSALSGTVNATLGVTVSAAPSSYNALRTATDVYAYSWASASTSEYRYSDWVAGQTRLADFDPGNTTGLKTVPLSLTAGGTAKLVLLSSRLRTGPSSGIDNAHYSIHSADATGTTNDPRLTVIVGDQVTYVGAGAANSGTAGFNAAYPSGLQDNDILLLVVETASQALPAITDWNDVITPPQTTAGNNTTSTRLTLRWFRYTGSGTQVAVGDSGDHQIARVFAFRGCVISGDPWDVTNTNTDPSTGTTVTFPAVTTTVDGTMIINCVALGDDAAATMTNPTNTDLVGVEVVAFDGTTAGNDGQIGVIIGYRETAGSVGSTTATISTGLHKALATIALKPEITSGPPARTMQKYAYAYIL